MRKKTLTDPRDLAEVAARVKAVQPASERRWGRMTAHQMICHLSDSFRVVIGEKSVSPMPGRTPLRKLTKWFALQVPLPWPHGVKTRPEVDQMAGGTKPQDFAADCTELMRLLDRFVSQPRSFAWQPHPIFGPLRDEEWMRWGYVHMDHHLRQFGV